MKIASNQGFAGKVMRDNDQYRLTDNENLKHLTVSLTEMKPMQSTNGHEHPGKEEVYFFTQGHGAILIKEPQSLPQLIPVVAGDVVAVPDGAFHKVVSGASGLVFTAVFEKYDRHAKNQFTMQPIHAGEP